jgi:hypothetical protein
MIILPQKLFSKEELHVEISDCARINQHGTVGVSDETLVIPPRR